MFDALLQLYAPYDVEQAFMLFGATCGPCAFAAFLRREVLEIRDFFPSFPERQFTNLPMMTRALDAAGLAWERVADWPKQGMALICGPEKYHSRHWIAVVGEFVYEVSLDTWLPRSVWERDFVPELARHHGSVPHEWRLEAGLEVTEFPQIELALSSC